MYSVESINWLIIFSKTYDKEYRDGINFHGQAYLDLHLRLNFEDFAIYSEFYIYDWVSFIAEIGGFLGLFLGYAVLTLVDLMEVVFNKFCEKSNEDSLENKEEEIKADSIDINQKTILVLNSKVEYSA